MRWSFLFVAFLLAACTAKPNAPAVAMQDGVESGADIAVYVASNGWHTGLILPSDAIPPGRLPETADFPESRYLEFGWGDAEFYPAKDPTTAMVLRAALTPTAAVMHVVGLPAEPTRVFPKAEIIRLQIDQDAFDLLLDHIGGSFDRGDDRRAVSVGPGLYPNSRFYPATGRFHLGNTCNSWTARGLATVGVALETPEIVRAEALMAQLRPLAAAQ